MHLYSSIYRSLSTHTHTHTHTHRHRHRHRHTHTHTHWSDWKNTHLGSRGRTCAAAAVTGTLASGVLEFTGSTWTTPLCLIRVLQTWRDVERTVCCELQWCMMVRTSLLSSDASLLCPRRWDRPSLLLLLLLMVGMSFSNGSSACRMDTESHCTACSQQTHW